MSTTGSLMADEDEAFVRRITYIMTVWTIVVVLAGVALVALRDPFAAFFGLAGVGF